jgi:Holliday junction resolvase
MAKTPEKVVKDKVVSVLKAEGVYYFFPATHGYGRSGVPDIVACVNGQFLAIECKAGNNKLTALQERELTGIINAKGVAVIINEENWGTVPALVQWMKSGTVTKGDGLVHKLKEQS